MVLFHAAVSIFGGLITVLLVYFFYRSTSVAAWGWIASFTADLPVFWFAPLGVTNMDNLLVVTHTLGIFAFPFFLALADVLLINLSLIRSLSWLPIPKVMRTVRKIEFIVERLERYHALPKPVRIQRVFLVGMLAGVVHLSLNLLIGSL